MTGFFRVTRRKAVRFRRCDSCASTIWLGDTYLEHVVSPQAPDLNNETWWRISECSECATRYGRGELLEAAPAEAP